MPRIHFPLAQSPGVVKDIDPYRLPNGAWSDVRNMLFRDAQLKKAFGYTTFLGSPSVTPYGLFYLPAVDTALWAYTGLAAVYAFDAGAASSDITRAAGAYTGTVDDKWTATYLHGIGILNNGVDEPQVWKTPATATLLTDMNAEVGTWTAGDSCRTIRAFGNYLVALDVTKSSTRHAQMVKWSHPAASGSMPSSWDETDATKDAGEQIISRTPGALVDCLPLGNANILYKEDSVHAMNFIGGGFIFGFNELFDSFGLMAPDAVAAFPGHHFVATFDDILVHNGVQAKSVIDSVNRRWLFNNIEFTAIQRSHVYHYKSRAEMWFNFVLDGGTTADMAYIYNYVTQSGTFRELPDVGRITFAPATRTTLGDTWGGNQAKVFASATDIANATNTFTSANHGYATGLVGQWTTDNALPTGISAVTNYFVIRIGQDTFKVATSYANAIAGTVNGISDDGTGNQTFTPTDTWESENNWSWGDTAFLTAISRTLFLNAVDASIDEFDETAFTEDGTNQRVFAERQSMPFVGLSDRGEAIVDVDSVKLFTELRPRITAAAGTEVQVYFGTQMFPGQTVTWQLPVTYVVETTEFIPLNISARFLSVRFEATGSVEWVLHGFSYDLEAQGQF